MSETDRRKDITVDEYVSSLDHETKNDTQILLEIMQRISNQEPLLYGIGTIGFGIYHYKYESGREGDAHTLAYYPRNSKITVYLMDGTARYEKLLEKLGKHTTTGYCIYIKKLSDINVSILDEILQESYKYITDKYNSGPIDHILWQTKK